MDPSHSSDKSSHNFDAMHCDGSDMAWSVSPEDLDDYPLKRRQRRQRLRSLHSFNSYVARSGIVAVAAIGSMLTTEMENMARVDLNIQHEDAHVAEGVSATIAAAIADVKSRLGWTVGSLIARLGALLSSLADAIGEPPQRMWNGASEDHILPLPLLLAINLCALCTVASLVFFIVSFCVNGMDPSETEAVEKVSQKQLLASNSSVLWTTHADEVDDHLLPGAVRIVSVFVLSLAAGSGLGFVHPAQSAMLCGC